MTAKVWLLVHFQINLVLADIHSTNIMPLKIGYRM